MKPISPYMQHHRQIKERRLFISQMLKASLASAFVLSAGESNARNFLAGNKLYTVGHIMDMVLAAIPGAPYAQTVDTLKSGNREMPVTGIITTMFTTVDIIQQAIKSNANFIIAHEPTFYNHTDDLNWVSPNHIVQQKKDLLEQHKITVWFEDKNIIINLPVISLGNLATHLKKQLGIAQVRVIGKLSQPCKRIALLPGASGGQAHLSIVEKERPDVLIAGDVHEWETAEYIRDTQQLGEKTALMVLGHSVSEEPGLQWLQGWLQPRLQGVVVRHIVSGNPFTWV